MSLDLEESRAVCYSIPISPLGRCRRRADKGVSGVVVTQMMTIEAIQSAGKVSNKYQRHSAFPVSARRLVGEMLA